MGLITTPFERALHLALFIVGGIAFAVFALAAVERLLGDGERPTIRLVHVAVPVALFMAVGLVERIYHTVH